MAPGAQGLVHGSPSTGPVPPPFQPWVLLGPRRPFHTHAGEEKQAFLCKPRAPTVKVLGRWMLWETEKRRIGAARRMVWACGVSLCVAVRVCAGAVSGDTWRATPAAHTPRGSERPRLQPGRGWGRGAPGRVGPAGHWGQCPAAGRLPDGAGAHRQFLTVCNISCPNVKKEKKKLIN